MKRSQLRCLPLEDRVVPDARLQLIHNSPFAETALVDVYINDSLFLDDFPFQTATEFLPLASNADLVIDVTLAKAKNNSDPLLRQTVNLLPGSNVAAVLMGDPLASGTAGLQLSTAEVLNGWTQANEVAVVAVHGSPDFGPVDLFVRDVGVIAANVPFAQFALQYEALPDTVLISAMTKPGGGIPFASSVLDLRQRGGQSAILLTSGFRDPLLADDPRLEQFVVFNDGTSVTLTSNVEPAYAAGTLIGDGALTVLLAPDGTTDLSLVAFPGDASPPRVASADFDGDGVADLIAGRGPGEIAFVRIFDGATGKMVQEFAPFGDFRGGVNVAVGDLTGDGIADYVVSPDAGGGPRVRVFNGATQTQLADFFGIEDVNFRGGARAAIGDMNNDSFGDLVVAAGRGGGPRIAIFDGQLLGPNGGPKLLGDFFAFEPTLRNGAFVAVGDVTGGGFADLIVGGGPGGGPRVRVFDGEALTGKNPQLQVRADFFAGNENERRGVRVAARDLNGDNRSDILTGGIAGGPAAIRVFLAGELPLSGFGTPALTLPRVAGFAPLGDVYVG